MRKSRTNVSRTPRPSSRSSKKTFRDFPRYREINTFVEKVKQREPVLAVLFGSVARGDFRLDSDADVLVVFSKPVELAQVYQDSDGTVQPVVKTLDQMDKFIREGEPFYIEMIEDGIPLYDSDGQYKKLSRLAREAKAAWGLKRTKGGWRWTNVQPIWKAAR